MKKISIIIPINQKVIPLFKKAYSLTKITEAFAQIDNELRKSGIDYEIILVTDNSTNISYKDIEIFPVCPPLQHYKEKENKKVSDLTIRGISLATYDYMCVLGGEWEYLPQVFMKIIADKSIAKNDVIASVKTHPSFIMPFVFKLRSNPENGALFFHKSLWNIISFKPINDNIFLIEFLKRAEQIGFTIKKYQISSYKAPLFRNTQNKYSETFASLKDIFSLHIKKIPPIYIPAQDETSMVNAGLFFNKHKYITHTTLKSYQSALEAFDMHLMFKYITIILISAILLFVFPLLFFQVFIGILSCIYLIDVCFNMFLVLKTFQHAPEISSTRNELQQLNNRELPVYSILCPLYKEAHILPQFIKGLEKLDWPKDKLDVIILLESDDEESIKAFQLMSPPSYMRSVVVPDAIPKTKPKACNYGLGYVKGEYTVIYDAEDIPDSLQLKKAFLGFKKCGSKVACLQAKLNYYNINQNILTRFFTIEYSLWFDLILTSLHSLNTIIPLGGTSNHFRTNDLRKLHAWDPFNVTEDADLGLRLFKLGFRTAILDSVTLEEGNSQLKNWIRQRSRWIKGYMQTYLVHSKKNISFIRKRGIHAIIFHLVIGGKLAFIIINPILWIVTLLYFTLYWLVGPTVDSLYPPFVLYVAITSLIFGNYLYLFCHLMACVKKEQWSLIKYVYFIPIYWIFISIAGFMALHQLIFKPFYWEKTVHGLHLKDNLAFSKAYSGSPASLSVSRKTI